MVFVYYLLSDLRDLKKRSLSKSRVKPTQFNPTSLLSIYSIEIKYSLVIISRGFDYGSTTTLTIRLAEVPT
jgi:hypothetical protein